jgi:hypothetical protein
MNLVSCQAASTSSSAACTSSSISADCAAQAGQSLTLTSRRPLAIKAGDTVALTGTGFSEAMTATVGGIPATSLSVSSATSASLVVPAGVTPGMADLKLSLSGTGNGSASGSASGSEVTASMAYMPTGGIPLITLAASEVCSGVEYYDINGDRQTGTKSCSSGSSSGSSSPNPWDVRAGVTVGGVTGKLKVNCRNAATLATFDLDAGRSVESVVDGVFNITAHGLADGTAVRLNYSTAPTGLDNSTTYYVVEASTDSFRLLATLNGTPIDGATAGSNATVHRWRATMPAVVDIWDTIDDYNGLPASTGFPSTWSVANNYCGGVEATAGDDNVWKDVTTSDGTTASTCTATPANCTMQDKISGLKWSNSYRNSGNQVQDTKDWWSAVNYCNASTYHGQPAGSWRLPTQKELMNAFEHGIVSTAINDNVSPHYWMTLANMQSSFWSASSDSYFSDNAWIVDLSNGNTSANNKDNVSVNVICVQ